MAIIDSIVNFFSVAPDSYAPLKPISAINLMFWVAMTLFLFENAIHWLGQFLIGKLPVILPFINPERGIAVFSKVINQSFIIFGYPSKFIELIQPFSPTIYFIVKIIFGIYGGVVAVLNMILGIYTEKQLDLIL